MEDTRNFEVWGILTCRYSNYIW